ncbi:MAG: FAD-dependent oxidoreductase [Pseudomonadota bacterium]
MSADGTPDRTSIAIIGAGLAGLSAAWQLTFSPNPPPHLTIFDKSRGLGGRLATRRLPNGQAFNHGAQYVRAGDPHLQRLLREASEQEHAAEWRAPIADGPPLDIDETRPRFIGQPGMSALGRHLMSATEKQARKNGVDIIRHRQTQIIKLISGLHGWLLEDQLGGQYGPFEQVLIAVPAPQAKTLLEDAEAVENGRLSRLLEASRTPMVPCWSLMVAFEKALPLGAAAKQFKDHDLAWIGSSNPLADNAAHQSDWHGYVVHAGPAWSEAHLEARNEAVADQLLEIVSAALDGALPTVVHKATHRWRYAFAPNASGQPCHHDQSLGLTLAGDWCLGNRAESAFLSGVAAARAINPQQ